MNVEIKIRHTLPLSPSSAPLLKTRVRAWPSHGHGGARASESRAAVADSARPGGARRRLGLGVRPDAGLRLRIFLFSRCPPSVRSRGSIACFHSGILPPWGSTIFFRFFLKSDSMECVHRGDKERAWSAAMSGRTTCCGGRNSHITVWEVGSRKSTCTPSVRALSQSISVSMG
jgi:hypothetical protein